MHAFIKASVSQLKIHTALVAARYRKLLRQMGVHWISSFLDVSLKLKLVNIDLSSLLLHLQMFDGQLTFDNT